MLHTIYFILYITYYRLYTSISDLEIREYNGVLIHYMLCITYYILYTSISCIQIREYNVVVIESLLWITYYVLVVIYYILYITYTYTYTETWRDTTEQSKVSFFLFFKDLDSIALDCFSPFPPFFPHGPGGTLQHCEGFPGAFSQHLRDLRSAAPAVCVCVCVCVCNFDSS